MPQYQLEALTALSTPWHTASPPALPEGQGRVTESQDSWHQVADLETATLSPEPSPGGLSCLGVCTNFSKQRSLKVITSNWPKLPSPHFQR